MASKNAQLALFKSFADAYKKGHPGMTKYACHYNTELEWNKIKNNAPLVKVEIEKYLELAKESESQDTVKATTTDNPPKPEKPISTTTGINERKRTLSSDDEYEPYERELENDVIIPVEPTFTKRDSMILSEFNDPSKPWVARSLARAHARAEARVAKIQARRLASESRIKTPVQEGVIKEIKEISERIASLIQVKNMGLSTADSNQTLKKLLQQKKERKAELSRLQSKQRSSARYRQRKKRYVETLCAADPEIASELLALYKPAAIRVQIDNICPDLIQTMEEIARIGGATEVNPRLLNPTPCASLDDLRLKVKERGFEIRRSSTYYRLIPAGIFSEDGKRRVNTEPVRLRKYQEIEQVKHEDCHFVNATLQHIKDLAGTFGNECVFYLIQDRKASVRIGRPSARGRSPFIMHLDYQTSTTNLTSSIPHQLKPTVYASCFIDEGGVLNYAGPTYISIRSEKYDRFTSESEDVDFDCIVKLKEFERTARNHIGTIKPIIIMGVDSLEPTDYTRLPSTLTSAINKFKKYNLDALFIVAQAPGQTAFNVVERRLASLSQDLTGLVLPHDYFGTHLNVSGVTINSELEKNNLKRAGDVLGEVWNMDMIDQYPVYAEYVEPTETIDDTIRLIDSQFTLDTIVDDICDEEEETPLHLRVTRNRPAPSPHFISDIPVKPVTTIDEYWCATHVFQSQYSIQIIRCTKPECCGPWRSNYIQVFPHRFLPPPVPFDRSTAGVSLAELDSSNAATNLISPYYGTLFQRIQFHGIVMERTNNLFLPFDSYCPSVQTKLHSRVCSICKQYVPTAARLRNHYRVHQQKYTANCIDYKFYKDEELIDELDPIEPSTTLPCQINPSLHGVFLFSDMAEWLKSDFEAEPVVESKVKSSASLANAMVRKEKQLQEAAAAAIGLNPSQLGQLNTVESAATISVDNALTSTDGLIPADDIKTESEQIDIVDVSTDNTNVIDAMEQLAVTDDSTDLANAENENLLSQYDDLSDLIDQI
ncbi:unnamed protein product [Adineta ricciae]|uniref:C2H2-type domain-containing protein n=1 Tax=Adineta ricciae TaxID=249248 RepID=A0A814DH14_ADIRI|nr:unnamed protein product [Adineta ricciae]CAF0955609.1 unnamed protein product [Adineta ricciae]